MSNIPVLTKKVLDDIRYVGKSYEWMQMVDKELSRKKNWSFGDYAAAILSLANFGYSVYQTIDDGGKLVNAALAPGSAKINRSASVMRKTSAIKKPVARKVVRKRAVPKKVRYRRLS